MILLLADQHIVVPDPRQGAFQLGQLVVVGREQGARVPVFALVQKLHDGPGDAQTVEGAGAAPQLIDQDEAARGDVVEDVGRLVHLHHEGALAPGQVVRGPHPGEDAIHHAEPDLAGRDKTAHLGHQHDQAYLPDDGALASHVGAGDQEDLVALDVQVHVVGYEAAIAELALHHRVPAGLDVDDVAVVDFRADVGFVLGHFGQAGQHVEAGQTAGDLLHLGGPAGGPGAQLQKELVLQLLEAFFGAQYLGLVLLQVRGDVALAIGQGLLADVVRGHPAQIGLADLDIVPEDLVEADLERGDAGALALVGLQPGNPVFAAGADLPQAVHVGIVPVADQAAIRQRRRGIVDQGLTEQLDQVAHLGQARGAQLLQQAAAQSLDQLAERWRQIEGVGQIDQVAGVGALAADPRDHPFQIAHLSQQLPHLTPRFALFDQVGHRVEPLVDSRRFGQGRDQPLAQQPRAHGGQGVVQDPEQGAFSGPVLLVAEQVQIALGRGVEQHVVGAALAGQPVDVVDGAALVVAQVVHGRAAGADAGFQLLAVKSFERPDLELFGQALVRGVEFELPVLDAADRNAGQGALQAVHPLGGRAFAQEEFGRGEPLEFVLDLGKGHLVEREVSGRQVDDGQPHLIPAPAQADQEVVALLVQHGVEEGRAWGHHLDHVPLDHPLGLFGVLHLVADGHLAAHLDQFGHVPLHGVVGYAGQGNVAGSLAVVAGRQRQTEQPGRFFGIVVEHFVEVTHAEEQDGVLVLALEVRVLFHGRGELGGWHG